MSFRTPALLVLVGALALPACGRRSSDHAESTATRSKAQQRGRAGSGSREDPSHGSDGLAAVLRDGDLVFQISQSAQSRAIREAQGSPWSHVGVIFRRGEQVRVLEAVQPVRYTPLSEWVARGQGQRIEIRRLRDAESRLTDARVTELRAAGERMLGRPYDVRFEWSDQSIYCSELVWKMYERTLEIELSVPERWRDLDLTGAAARKLATKRLGAMPDPEAPVVTPRALMESPALVRVAVP